MRSGRFGFVGGLEIIGEDWESSLIDYRSVKSSLLLLNYAASLEGKVITASQFIKKIIRKRSDCCR
jgi:hypothetical protein